MNYNLIMDSVSGGNIGECQTNPCDLSPCLNDGVCLSSGGTFQCQCRFGFEGSTCSNGMWMNFIDDIIHVFFIYSDYHQHSIL